MNSFPAPPVSAAPRDAVDASAEEKRNAELAGDRVLQHLLTHSPAVIYVLRIAGELQIPVVIADSIGALLGFSVAETLEDEWWPAQLHPADRAAAIAAVAVTRATGRGRSEYRIRHKDGSYRWVEDNMQLVVDAQGAPTEIIGVWTDITGRKCAEECSCESERRFREMLENVQLIAMTLDWEGRVTFCNDYLARVTGWSREEIFGSDWFEKFIPPSAAGVRSLFFEKVAAGEIPAHYENPIVTRSGELRDIGWSNTMLRDATGAVIGTASIGDDVTDCRQAEQALRESEERFRQVAENINGVFWLCDPANEQLFYISPAYEAIWGRSCASVLASPRAWFDAVHPDDRERVGAALAGMANGFEIEFRIVRPDGSERWIRDRGFPVRDGGGRIYRVAGISEDITERKAAEDARRASEERTAAMFHASPIPVSYGSPSGQLIDVNEQFAAYLGYSREEMIGRTVQELRMWANAADRGPVMARLLKEGVVLNHEAKFRRKTGEIRTALLSMQSLQLSNEPIFLAMMVDITTQKAMEAQMHRTERVESVGRLASGIAHDMNNILAPIMMAAPLLRMPLQPADVEKTLTTIEVSARRGADLVKQLLTFGRGIEGERGVVDCARLVREMSKVAAETFPKSIDVIANAADDLWPMEGDTAQLHQVLLNLCVNARDAMPRGGRLTLSATNVRLDDSYASMHPDAKPGDYVQLSVADTGTGIPPEIADKIFEPFFTTKKVGQGTGLGLSTVAGVIKAHGGTITVRSAMGQGTTFTVFVPAMPDAIGAPAKIQPPPPPLGHGELILVVDDEECVRGVLREMLVRHGYRVVTAIDGADGLVAFARAAGEIKLVITDLDMPVMDGVNLSRALRRMEPELRIVISTGLGGESGPEKRQGEIEALGVCTILMKPYTAEHLLQAIHRVLAEPRYNLAASSAVTPPP